MSSLAETACHPEAPTKVAAGDVSQKQLPRILLIGNPNVGKSVLFGLLTGKYVTVSNYPGTSVEVTFGRMKLGNVEYELIDTPGVNGLHPRSEDERVTRDILLDRHPYGVVQVIDAKNLLRGLMMTHQLIEYEIPLIVVLNLWDEAEERHIKIDAKGLSRALGVPVIPTVATMRHGISDLKTAMQKGFTAAKFKPEFHPVIEEAAQNIAKSLPLNGSSPIGAAYSILSGDKSVLAAIHHGEPVPEEIEIAVKAGVAHAKERFFEPLPFLISRTRKMNMEERFGSFIETPERTVPVWRERLGNWMMHPLWGVPFLLGVLYLMYELVGIFAAGTVVNWIEHGFFGGINPDTGERAGLLNPFLIDLLTPLKAHGAIAAFFVDMFVGRYGLITVGLTYAVAIVLPVIFFFFLAFGILEDSGYLPRLTILSNRLFKRIGLNGRAVLPMVLGLGCDTMATFTVRTLESRKERMVATMLLALGVPCSAQLGVILGMSSAMNPLVLTIIGFTVLSQLVIVGWTASRILPGKVSSFLMEIPPIRTPRLKNLFIKTGFRVKWFLVEAVPLFIIGTGILFIVDKIGLLQVIENFTKPVMTGLLSLPPESARAFLLGFLRRDYGAAGLFMLEKQGLLSLTQITVSLTVMILFIPCLASFFAIIKEQGAKVGAIMTVFISMYALAVGVVLNIILRNLHVFAS